MARVTHAYPDADSPSWTAPESWAVEKEGEDPTAPYSSSDESARGKSGRKRRKRPPGNKALYNVRIYRANNSYHVVQCGLDVTVAQLTPQLNKKLLLDPGVEPHRLHLKERGRGANREHLVRRTSWLTIWHLQNAFSRRQNVLPTLSGDD